NFFLNFEKPITPMINYQLYLRTNLLDSNITDSAGITSTTSHRSLEPSLGLSLRHSMFYLDTGYRRHEQWSTTHLLNDDRQTTEFYYSRFNITPMTLPSLSIQVDRQRDFDHLYISALDRTDTTYVAGSAYTLPSRDLNLTYNINYSHNVDETPLSTTEESTNDNFSSSYNIHYSGLLWDDKVNYSLGYQGNYSRNKREQLVASPGTWPVEREGVGLWAQGLEQNELTSEIRELTDDDFSNATAINLDNPDNHIGILVLPRKSVDKLYIYVNQDVSTETNLNTASDWKVFRSDSNTTGSWISVDIPIGNENIIAFEPDNNSYRYEIEFLQSQNALYYKAINSNTSSLPNVQVTEIEAWGTDTRPKGHNIEVSTSFAQRLAFNAGVTPLRKLKVSFHYSLDRADQDPLSLTDSISGAFTNILGNSLKEEQDFRSNVIRSYGIASAWMTHRLLTTTLRLQRNETFDNIDESDADADAETNTYYLSFNSVPFPTLDATMSLVKSDRFSSDTKDSTNNSFLLNVGADLHRDVRMVTDLGYTHSDSFKDNRSTSNYVINGSFDTLLTAKLSTDFRYGFSWTSPKGESSRKSKDGAVLLTYRPGRFINLTGSFSISDSNSDITISEGLLMDWLPLPAIRLNVSYKHIKSEPGPSTDDSFSGFGTWHITKFMNAQLTYSYTKSREVKTSENHNLSTNLSLRF
ncbi:MAG: hypothetical protein KAJ10_07435, partial [Thermodesulfovibrionia bacterium]|nr:hypothetical protein [Thermodesulfovibrionia bacterium]